MRFSISTAFQPVGELLTIARAAPERASAARTTPAQVVTREALATPYPSTPDGQRRWDHSADWPDPWVLAGAMAAVTTNIHFYTSVYVAALRSPYQVAKAVG